MNKEVEILKIGYLVGSNNFIVASDGGPVYDYYISILKNKYPECKFYKASRYLVGTPFGRILTANPDRLIGVPYGEPIVGQPYALNNICLSSSVQCVIEDCVLVTLDSVYAIHNSSNIRDKKLKDLFRN